MCVASATHFLLYGGMPVDTKTKEYILKVYEIEKSLYVQRSFREKLLNKKDEMVNWEPFSHLNEWEDEDTLKELRETADNEAYSTFISVVFPIIFMVFVSAVSFYVTRFYWHWWLLFSIIMTAIVALFSWLGGAGIAASLHRRKMLDIYHELQREGNDEIDRSNREQKKKNESGIVNINNELSIINASIQKTEEILDGYYGLNVIYPKYRNLPAMDFISEYIQSGICHSLKGTDGAYYLYDLKVRHGEIISRLDQIIDKLDQIQQSQYYLYQFIQETNKNTERLISSVDHSIELLSDIRQSNEVIQYNSEISARNSQYQSALMAFHVIAEDM